MAAVSMSSNFHVGVGAGMRAAVVRFAVLVAVLALVHCLALAVDENDAVSTVAGMLNRGQHHAASEHALATMRGGTGISSQLTIGLVLADTFFSHARATKRVALAGPTNTLAVHEKETLHSLYETAIELGMQDHLQSTGAEGFRKLVTLASRGDTKAGVAALTAVCGMRVCVCCFVGMRARF